METLSYVAIIVLSVILTLHSAFILYQTLFTRLRMERRNAVQPARFFVPKRASFSVMIPARHEEVVIEQTIRRIWQTNYPKELLEIIVVCARDDTQTIAVAQQVVEAIGHGHVRLVIFDNGPINKPHALNVALKQTRYEVIAIFDAEDDVHPDLFDVVNTTIQRSGARVVQCGVQLMDFQSSWYALHNVLEYFFWFSSKAYFHARAGVVPLVGTTVFVRRELLQAVNGWDEACLTEDADLGLRLSALGEPISIIYDPAYTTREETPPTIASFVKQRTRWNQGALQVLRKGSWHQLPFLHQRLLAIFTLVCPFVQTLLELLSVSSMILISGSRLPPVIALCAVVPLGLLGVRFLIYLAGLFEFASSYHLRIRTRDVFTFVLGFVPYQALLAVSVLRALQRAWSGSTYWEKTTHRGAHRRVESLPLLGDLPTS